MSSAPITLVDNTTDNKIPSTTQILPSPHHPGAISGFLR